MNIPTLLTLLRIAVLPFLIIFYFLPFHWAHPVAAILFTLAALTDWLDGYLARSLSQATKFGAFLDPVADKLMVAAALIMIVSERELGYITLAAIIIVGREIVISALREWMAEMGKRQSIAVSMLGKIKTACQMVSLVILLWYHPGNGDWFWELGTLLLYIAAALTLWSMFIYLRLAWPDFKAHR